LSIYRSSLAVFAKQNLALRMMMSPIKQFPQDLKGKQLNGHTPLQSSEKPLLFQFAFISSKVDDCALAVVPDAHVTLALIAGLDRNRCRFQSGSYCASKADEREHANKCHSKRSRENGGQRQNCDAGSRYD
jgi:hypothetical protein